MSPDRLCRGKGQVWPGWKQLSQGPSASEAGPPLFLPRCPPVFLSLWKGSLLTGENMAPRFHPLEREWPHSLSGLVPKFPCKGIPR